MSMLSAQIKELREMAVSLGVNGVCSGDLSKLYVMLREAADTIESLRNTLQELQGVGGKSHYTALFGTPERAARTLESMSLDSSNWCRYDAEGQLACKACPCEFDSHGCYDPASLLEWLRGDAK